MPADVICASAAPTNTMRRSTTYTPSTEHASAMTSAPYNASRKRRTVLNTVGRLLRGLTARDDNAVAVEPVDLDRNAVHLRQRLLRHDLVGGADAKSAFDDQSNPLDVVGDFVERVTDHQHREAITVVELAHQSQN